jgi:hypothetical protein
LLARRHELAYLLASRVQHPSTGGTVRWRVCRSASYFDGSTAHRYAFHQSCAHARYASIHFLLDFLQGSLGVFLAPRAHLNEHFLRDLVPVLLILCFHLCLFSFAELSFLSPDSTMLLPSLQKSHAHPRSYSSLRN